MEGHVYCREKVKMRMIVEAGRGAVGGLGDVLGTYYPSSCLIPSSPGLYHTNLNSTELIFGQLLPVLLPDTTASKKMS